MKLKLDPQTKQDLINKRNNLESHYHALGGKYGVIMPCDNWRAVQLRREIDKINDVLGNS